MKRYSSNYRMILLCALLLGMTNGGTLASTLTLEDTRGRRIEVEVREVTDDSVTFLHLGNNHEYTIPLSKLSDASQNKLKAIHLDESKSSQSLVDNIRVPDARDNKANQQRNIAMLRKKDLTPQAEDVTFTCVAADTALTITPQAKVSLTRNGKLVSKSESHGWSIYNWIDGATPKNGTRIALGNMAQIAPDQLLLWSNDRKYHVTVAITANDRYFKFELIHVSNNSQTGGLDDDWPGHRVEFDGVINTQADGWKLNTLRLNPMSELKGRWNNSIGNGAHFRWPYPQWAQTDNRPQPQGAVAVFGFASDAEHDDILADIWVAEESLPRPNRANRTSWTRDDVDAWVDECETFYGTPWRTLNFDPQGNLDPQQQYANLYTAADLAHEGGLNAIYLSQHSWQAASIGTFNPKLFPKGRDDAIAWRQYCDDRGISLKFHGFSHLIRKVDPDYGRGVVHEELAKSARGTLLQDVPAEAKGLTILVEPDWDYYLGMKEGMLPFYDINKLPEPRDYNGGLGGTFPPYYEGMSSLISLNKNLYRYTASVTPDNKWAIELDDDNWARPSTTPLVDHKAGDPVEFILASGNGGYYLPDSRSDLLVQQAIGYAQLLNDAKTGDGYDGAAWTEDLGSWGLRRFSQEVYERMDHPGGGASSFGIRFFGHFEFQFKCIQKSLGERGGNIPVYLSEQATLAPSLDAACQGAGKSAKGKDIGLRAIHSGLTVDTIEGYGLWEEAGDMLKRWSELKPYLTTEQARTIADTKDDFYVASETEGHWQLTRTRAMRRDGIDGNWNVQAERPPVAPRQFFKANGETLSGLKNPYANQSPVVELHVMADMSGGDTENMSLMPTSDADITNPDDAEQTLGFNNGNLRISFDNSQSTEPYEYYARLDTVGHWLHSIDMSNSRGVAITVNGDGSGSTLVLSTGGFPRRYAVDIDFEGERTIEIPNGEAANNRERWDIFQSGSISQFNYAKVDRFRLFLHDVPAGKSANIEVTNIEAMKEDRETGLIDPVLTLNGATAAVSGTISYNHYLVYSEGTSAKVYGPNWKFVEDLPVTAQRPLEAVQGNNTFSVAATQSPDTWLSSRIKVEDTANIITIAKPAGFDSG